MKFIASHIKVSSLNAKVLIVFKWQKESQEKVILDEIKFLENERMLVEYNNNKKYEFFENPLEIKQELIKKSLNLIENYLSGGYINLYDEFKKMNIEIPLREKFPSSFSYKVIQSLLKIKYGESTSYSYLGDAIGSRAYRAIGNILRKNPFPLIIPCHRVLRKNGQIGGFMGSRKNLWKIELKNHLIQIEQSNTKLKEKKGER